MDLARHARPLVEHAGLAGLGDELPLEPDVLLQATSSWATRLAALLAQLGQPLAEDRPEPDRDASG